ncbi:MAG: Asp-tRNA(Asn)/Glu-tRNA(Gln) amidotransferase subunit GatC [Candidatus Omnitrophota bacterium]
MPISKKEVEYIGHLARLELTLEEVTHFQGQLEGILGYIDKLKSVDVSKVSPMAHVLDVKNVVRADEVKESIPIEKILEQAPKREAGFFVVPKVIE